MNLGGLLLERAAFFCQTGLGRINSRFTDNGIEGVVPPELLPPEIRSKFHAKPTEKNKRAKKEDDGKGAAVQPEDNQVATPAAETDGGSGGELEDGAAPVDSDVVALNITQGRDMTPEESTKQCPDIDMGQETGQSEAEAEAEAEVEVEAEAETDADAKPNVKADAEPEPCPDSETNPGTKG